MTRRSAAGTVTATPNAGQPPTRAHGQTSTAVTPCGQRHYAKRRRRERVGARGGAGRRGRRADPRHSFVASRRVVVRQWRPGKQCGQTGKPPMLMFVMPLTFKLIETAAAIHLLVVVLGWMFVRNPVSRLQRREHGTTCRRLFSDPAIDRPSAFSYPYADGSRGLCVSGQASAPRAPRR